uniref:Uncharacterized protein n=1 Tax=Myoviridae sp. ctwwN25 TaxID=2825209 RepID=A0A8S5PN27_9CAUD|nr:MAG TPA: hypothetical protein [Myoviridae sp. ctwwN25]
MASIFDNVQLENCFVLEGEQADAYKAKKATEKSDKESAERKQFSTRYDKDNYGNKYTSKNPNYQKDKKAALNGDDDAWDKADREKSKDSRRMSDAANKANKDYYSGKRPMNHDQNVRAIDAANRHMRRHPEKKVSEALDMLASIDYPYNG